MTARQSTQIERLVGLPDKRSWPSQDFQPPSIRRDAMARACAALETQAAITARAMIKDRARAYALRPRELDMFTVGTCRLSPRDLVLFLKLLTTVMHDRLAMTPLFGGEIPSINLKAAMLYARYSRRVASRNARRAAS